MTAVLLALIPAAVIVEQAWRLRNRPGCTSTWVACACITGELIAAMVGAFGFTVVMVMWCAAAVQEFALAAGVSYRARARPSQERP